MVLGAVGATLYFTGVFGGSDDSSSTTASDSSGDSSDSSGGGSDDSGDGGSEGGDIPMSDESPEDAVNAYIEAIKNGDCEAALEHMKIPQLPNQSTMNDDQMKQQMCDNIESGTMMGDVESTNFTTEPISHNGDEAKVELSNGITSHTLTLKLIDGTWKIDFLASMGQTPSGGGGGF